MKRSTSEYNICKDNFRLSDCIEPFAGCECICEMPEYKHEIHGTYPVYANHPENIESIHLVHVVPMLSNELQRLENDVKTLKSTVTKLKSQFIILHEFESRLSKLEQWIRSNIGLP
jgi:hypothetical protein